MTICALLLLAASSQMVLVDEEVIVSAGRVKAINVDLRQRPAVVETTFEVLEGEPVDVSLIGGEGQRRRYVRRTVEQRNGTIRYAARDLGAYQVVLDGRGNEKGTSRVSLRVTLLFESAGLLEPGTVPPRRRSAIVALSLLFFLLIAAYTGWKLKAAIEQRRSDEQLPLS